MPTSNEDMNEDLYENDMYVPIDIPDGTDMLVRCADGTVVSEKYKKSSNPKKDAFYARLDHIEGWLKLGGEISERDKNFCKNPLARQYLKEQDCLHLLEAQEQ